MQFAALSAAIVTLLLLLLEDHCSFLLPVCVLQFCFLIIIVFPTVARDVFCPLHYSPACSSKAAWIQGSPILGVHRLRFLTLHSRCICHGSVHLGIGDSLSRGLLVQTRRVPFKQPHLWSDVVTHYARTVLCAAKWVAGASILHCCTTGLLRASEVSTPYKQLAKICIWILA